MTSAPDPAIVPAQSAVLARTRATVDLLAAATADRVPEPRYVTIDTWKIGIQLASADEVAAWGDWLGVEVNSDRVTDNEGRIYRADGWRDSLHVNAYHVEYGEAAA